MRFLNSFVAIAALAAAPFTSAQSLAVKEFIAYGQSHPVRHTSLAARQSLANLPTCAQPAIEKGITSTPCPLTDYSCICHSEGFIDGVDTSIKASCSADDQKATLAFADQVCTSAGAPLKNDAAAAPATSAPAASAPAESAPATSAADAAAPEATDSSTPMSSAAPATVPTVTPPYPAGNASGSANCTNSTTPFLGAANELHISSIPSLVSLAFFALFGVLFL